MSKKKILFVARTEQQNTVNVVSDVFDSYYAVLQRREKKVFSDKGIEVSGCFEEEYAVIEPVQISGNYLKTSLSTDRFLYRFPFEKRLEILGKEIQFWRNVLDKVKPDFIVNETVAIEFTEVLCIEAEAKGIPMLTYLPGFYSNTFYWKPDPFSARMDDLSTIEPTADELEEAQKYISRVIENHERPYYVQSMLKKDYFRFGHLLSELIRSIPRYIREKLKESEKPFYYECYSPRSFGFLKAYWRNLWHSDIYDDVKDMEGKNLVFYPMHMEPEATLNYFVDNNPTQEMVVRSILNSMSTDQCLVVKEHPQHPGLLETKAFRDLKKYNKNVIYLKSSVSSFDVLSRVSVITTLTSTAAWEGLLLGKPVVVLGKIFFDQCPGATRCNDFNELANLLRNKAYSIPQKETTLRFVAAMASRFHKGSPTLAVQGSKIEDFITALETLCNE